ncbi:hypothetical protein AVEN_170013-1, partial [Araneus ventricosus]
SYPCDTQSLEAGHSSVLQSIQLGKIRTSFTGGSKMRYRRLGRGSLVVRSRLWGRRVPGSKPDSTEDPPCMGPVVS